MYRALYDASETLTFSESENYVLPTSWRAHDKASDFAKQIRFAHGPSGACLRNDCVSQCRLRSTC